MPNQPVSPSVVIGMDSIRQAGSGFLDAAIPRAGQHGAIGADVIALMYALKIPIAVLAGFNWGGRAACVAAALWPERCTA